MSSCEAVGCTWIIDFPSTFDEYYRLYWRILDGNYLSSSPCMTRVGTSIFEILRKIGLRECLDAIIGTFETSLHTPQPKLIQQSLRDIGSRFICAIKGYRQVLVKLRAVLYYATSQVVKCLYRKSFRIGI
jgi:hypothetical protein